MYFQAHPRPQNVGVNRIQMNQIYKLDQVLHKIGEEDLVLNLVVAERKGA